MCIMFAESSLTKGNDNVLLILLLALPAVGTFWFMVWNHFSRSVPTSVAVLTALVGLGVSILLLISLDTTSLEMSSSIPRIDIPECIFGCE